TGERDRRTLTAFGFGPGHCDPSALNRAIAPCEFQMVMAKLAHLIRADAGIDRKHDTGEQGGGAAAPSGLKETGFIFVTDPAMPPKCRSALGPVVVLGFQL